MATSSTKKTRQKPAPRGITWEGAERPPAKRWWWFLGFGYVSLVGVLVTISLDNWTFAAVLVVASIALVVTYLGKPHHVQARLTQSELTVNKQAFPLVNYRSFRTDRDDAVVLVPRRLPRLRVLVPLSGDESKDKRIVHAFEARLPFEDSAPDLLDHLIRWLNLS